MNENEDGAQMSTVLNKPITSEFDCEENGSSNGEVGLLCRLSHYKA